LKILLITNKLPYPKVDGRKNILMQYIKHLKKIYPESTIINLSFVDEERYLSLKPNSIDRTITLSPPGIYEKMTNLLFKSLILRDWPLQVSLFFSRKTARVIKGIVEEEQPDIVIYDTIRVAEYKRYIQNVKKNILNYDDLLSLRYKRQLMFLEYSPSILGFLLSKIPRFISKIIDHPINKRIILKYEMGLLQKYEIKVNRDFESLVFTSKIEAQEFKEKVTHSSCIGIPMNSEIAGRPVNRSYDPNKIVFVGRMDVPHNIAAVLYFCKEIWSEVKKKHSSAKFYIIGKNPSQQVKALQSDYKDVIVTGEVDDVEHITRDAAVFVAPLLFGSGIKTKIIEAMIQGIPVVSTTVGAEGISINNDFMYVTDERTEFANRISTLLQDTNLNKKRSINGYNYVVNNFSEDRNNRLWQSILLEQNENTTYKEAIR